MCHQKCPQIFLVHPEVIVADRKAEPCAASAFGRLAEWTLRRFALPVLLSRAGVEGVRQLRTKKEKKKSASETTEIDFIRDT